MSLRIAERQRDLLDEDESHPALVTLTRTPPGDGDHQLDETASTTASRRTVPVGVALVGRQCQREAAGMDLYLMQHGVATAEAEDPARPLTPVGRAAVEVMANRVQALDRDNAQEAMAIVGHLPFLDRLASLLIAGRDDAHVVFFQNAALVKLVPKASGRGYAVAWVLTPDLA